MVISGHNLKVLKERGNPEEGAQCNCRRGATCPLEGHCLQTNVVYQATVSTQGEPDETYIGLSAPSFKKRFGNHKKSFEHPKYETETTLSKHIWKLKRNQQQFNIKWKIISRAKPFSPVTQICELCTAEKFNIVFRPELGTLNKREEMKNHCRHKVGVLLDKT